MTMARTRILIVEDEVIVREDLRDRLEALGYDVAGSAVAGKDAIAKAEALQPGLILMDIKLKDEMDGIEAAQTIRQRFALPVVFLTAFADESTIARAAAACPYGYLTKPFNDRAIRATLEVALHRHREEHRPVVLSSDPPATKLANGESFHGLIGRSGAMRSLYTQILQVAPVSATVLIAGETGTGKERVARAIHQAGRRAAQPFLAVNCAGLTETLAASELFGHRRGAFTGALQDHKGVFEAAAGGTIFLDEIGDVPKSQQPFLLRVLEEREITRVGETAPRRVEARVVAASNRSLEEEVAAGRFRSDLFFRIRVARIVVPPLRERLEDVALLAPHFLAQLRAKAGSGPGRLSGEALERLQGYRWPGNVRELRNAMEYAAIRGSGDTVRAGDLPPEVVAGSEEKGLPAVSPEEERARLLAALEAAEGNRSEAARRLGISRATLYRWMSEAGLPGSGD